MIVMPRLCDDSKDHVNVDAAIDDDDEYCDPSGLLDLQTDCLHHLFGVAGVLGRLLCVWHPVPG